MGITEFYDGHYELDQTDFLPGKGLLKALRVRGADFSLPFLEIGSGTDSLSFGLMEENLYPVALLTDPSFELVKMFRQKLQKNKLDDPDTHLAVLEAEEINQLPDNAFSLIALRSTLHHILDVPKFIYDSSRLLTTGGFLAFEEPCLEGFVLMGTMVQFLPLVMEKSGLSLKEEQKTKIDNFVQTMKYYARRGLDKTSMEDKHLFRPDEIMKICISSGFAVEFIPNVTFDGYLELGESADNFFSFHNFFRDYLKYCIGFDDDLLNLFEKHFEPYNRFIEDISAKNNAPHCYSIFFCRKL